MHLAETVKMALYYNHRTPRPMPGITVSSGAFEHRDPMLVEPIGEQLTHGQLAASPSAPPHVAPVRALRADELPLALARYLADGSLSLQPSRTATQTSVSPLRRNAHRVRHDWGGTAPSMVRISDTPAVATS
jgi:hypothetical protein